MRIQPIFLLNFKPSHLVGSGAAENKFLHIQKSDTFEYSANIPQANTSQPIPFKGFGCSTENFGPRNLYDIPCASCGKKTLLLRQIDAFVSKARDKEGMELIKVLESKNSYYKKTEKKVVEQTIQHLREHPDNDLLEAIKALKLKYLESLEESQIAILNKVKETASKNLNAKQAEKVAELTEEAKAEAKNRGETYFKRKNFLERLELYGRSSDGEFVEGFEEIYKIAKNLPSSSSSVPAFFAKYAKRSNDEIARRLLLPSQATTEHVIPQNPIYGGEDRTDNFIVMCGDCNSKRSSMPYTEWLKIQPRMKSNFKAYIAEISERIKIGELGEEYATYPFEVSQTVKMQSEGQITAHSADYIQREVANGKTKRVKETPSFEDRLGAAQRKFEKAQLRLESLQNRHKALQEDPEYNQIFEYYELRHLFERLREEKKDVESKLPDLEKRLHLNSEREEKKARYEKDIRDPGLSAKARNKAKKYLQTVTGRLQREDAAALEKIVTELKARKIEIDRQITDCTAKQEQYLVLVNLPETIIKQENLLKEQPQTPGIIKQLGALLARRIEIQEKINAVRIDREIEKAQKEFDDAQSCFENLRVSKHTQSVPSTV